MCTNAAHGHINDNNKKEILEELVKYSTQKMKERYFLNEYYDLINILFTQEALSLLFHAHLMYQL